MWPLDNFIPKILHTGSTKYNKDIKVVKIGKTLKLISGGVTQSYNKDSKYAAKKIWGEVANTITKHKTQVSKILLLGMGAGTMLHFLKDKLKPRNLHFTSVEIDQEIVDIAKKYFDLDQIPNHKIIVSDAWDVIANPSKHLLDNNFDCIIVDTYKGHEISGDIHSSKFFEDFFKFVNNDCLVIFNIVRLKKDKTKLSDFLQMTVKYLNPIKYKVIKYKAFSDNYLVYGFKTNK